MKKGPQIDLEYRTVYGNFHLLTSLSLTRARPRGITIRHRELRVQRGGQCQGRERVTVPNHSAECSCREGSQGRVRRLVGFSYLDISSAPSIPVTACSRVLGPRGRARARAPRAGPRAGGRALVRRPLRAGQHRQQRVVHVCRNPRIQGSGSGQGRRGPGPHRVKKSFQSLMFFNRRLGFI